MTNGDPFEFLSDTPEPPAPEPAPKGRAKPANFSRQLASLMDRHGFHCGLVERTVQAGRWNPDTEAREILKTSKLDLFGFADYVAVHRLLPGTTYIQVCRASDITTRLKSACTEDASQLPANRRMGKAPRANENRLVVLTDLLLSGNRFWIIGYAKGNPRHGQRADRWYETIIDVTLEVVRRVQSGERIMVAKLPTVNLERLVRPGELVLAL